MTEGQIFSAPESVSLYVTNKESILGFFGVFLCVSMWTWEVLGCRGTKLDGVSARTWK